MSAPLLSVRLSAGYGKQPILRDLHLEIAAGERLALVGSSGAGKSTLLLALLGLLDRRGGWAKGEVLLNGRNLLALGRGEVRKLRGKELALVPQSPLSALNPALSLQTHFEAAWAAHRRPDRKDLGNRVAELMRRVGLPDDPAFLKRKPGQISVGQAQRCTLALAMLHRPRLIIADEPTSALDPVTSAEVLRLLREVSEEEGTSLLFVSHDLLSVFRLCTDLAVLSAGAITECLPIADVSRSRDPELRALIQALPVPVAMLLPSKPAEREVVQEPEDVSLLALSL